MEGIAIDNEVIGIPQVQCSEDAVTFAVRTRNAFTGNIYIKGKFNEPACRQEFFSNSFNGASYTVRIPRSGAEVRVELSPQVYTSLLARSRRTGQSMEKLVLRLARKIVPHLRRTRKKT